MAKRTTTSGDAGQRALLARAAGGSDEAGALRAIQADDAAWAAAGAAKPYYPMAALLRIVDQSSILPQCIEAMAGGIDGWGHTFEPRVDIDAKDLDDQIRAAIVLEREADAREAALARGETDWTADYAVDDAEVRERRATLERQVHIQRFRAEAFFEACAVGGSATSAPWVELRRRMRRDQYAVGHGVLEVVRDATGDPAQVGYVPAHTILPRAKQPPPVVVDVEVPVSPIATRTVKRRVEFQHYVQQVGTRMVYFKDFGDPRVVSGATGEIYKSAAALHSAEDKRDTKVAEATEVLYFPLHSPLDPAGLIPWGGQVPNVLGLRAAEEVNYSWFDDKCVPPGAWIITGGMLEANVKAALEDHISTNIKGRANYYRPLIIELVAPSGVRGEKVEQPKVQWLSFRADLQDDATHQAYTASARDNVRSAFRLPKMLTGDVQADLTRANAYASLEFADTHVYTPPRRAFDWVMNTTLLPALGITLYRFVSLGPDLTDPETITQVIDVAAKHGGALPGDVRAVANRLLPVPLPPYADAPWTQQPLALTLAGFAADQLGVPADQVGREVLAAFGRDAPPEKRALATKILGDFFASCGYELQRVTALDTEAL
jgi:capsid portal protein